MGIYQIRALPASLQIYVNRFPIVAGPKGQNRKQHSKVPMPIVALTTEQASYNEQHFAQAAPRRIDDSI